MSRPRAWIEVMDPETERKVDVVVGFHSDWASIDGPTLEVDRTNAIAGKVLKALQAAGFDLSDYGEAE